MIRKIIIKQDNINSIKQLSDMFKEERKIIFNLKSFNEFSIEVRTPIGGIRGGLDLVIHGTLSWDELGTIITMKIKMINLQYLIIGTIAIFVFYYKYIEHTLIPVLIILFSNFIYYLIRRRYLIKILKKKFGNLGEMK